MKRFLKILSIAAALIICVAAFAGCRNSKDISEKLDLIFEVCVSEISDESGEILIYRNVSVEKDIEDVLAGVTEETFVQFRNNTGAPDFNLTRTSASSDSDETLEYEFAKEGEFMVELFNGSGDIATEAPDIFEEFKIRFSASDVEKIEVSQQAKGFKEYKITMKAAYADGFDTEEDGLLKDCTGVVYCYYIDNYKNLSNILRQFNYKATYEGETQKVVEIIDAKID